MVIANVLCCITVFSIAGCTVCGLIEHSWPDWAYAVNTILFLVCLCLGGWDV